tara:strand:+ start:16442 stop:17137 length:696 start_codon:yes stop_codon:yes gene_type:complete
MKKIKNILVITLISISTLSFSEVVEVYQWKAFPGKNMEMMESMMKAANIHEKQGAAVAIDVHNVGSTQQVNYVLRWNNSESYAKSKDLQASSQEWVEFWAEANKNPSGEMMASFSANNLDQTRKASDFDGSYVYSANIWKVEPGKDRQLIERFMQSKPILEKAGARVEIYQANWGAPGEYHYVLMFDSWSDLQVSFSKLGQGSEWAEYMQSRANDEVIAEQTAWFTGQTAN